MSSNIFEDWLPWLENTREERYFCHHLAAELERWGDEKINTFLGALIKEEPFFASLEEWVQSKPVGRNGKAVFRNRKIRYPDLSVQKQWEVGFEVALYRDLIYKQKDLFQKLVDKYIEILPKKNTDKESEEYKKSVSKTLQKRTFDICLFNPNMMIVIEAKAYDGFKTKQLEDFKADRILIETILGSRHNANIFYWGLVSSKYPGGSRCDVLTRKDEDGNPVFDLLFTWRYLEEWAKSNLVACPANDVFKRANKIYKHS